MSRRIYISTVEARKLRGFTPADAADNRSRPRDGKGKFDDGKYGNRGERVDGHWFASGAEAERYRQLTRLQKFGIIDQLALQKRYPLTVNGVHLGEYRADFAYWVLDELKRPARHVVEDVKGMVLDVYVLKKKLMKALHGVEIHEIPADKIKGWVDKIP